MSWRADSSDEPILESNPVARGLMDTGWSGLGHVTILELVRNAISPSCITWTKSGRREDDHRKIRALIGKEGEVGKYVEKTDVLEVNHF